MEKPKMSITAISSLIISIFAFILYAMVLDGSNVYILWIFASTAALCFPVFSKYCRNKKSSKGKAVEIIALILGAFDFYCVIFAATAWNIYIAFALIAIVCVLYAKLFNNLDKPEETKNPEKEISIIPPVAESEQPAASKITEVQKVIEVNKDAQPLEVKNVEYAAIPSANSNRPSKQRYCKFCGGIIDNTSRKCTNCGKQYLNFKFIMGSASTKIAVIIIIALTAACILQYNQHQENISTISALNDEILALQEEADNWEEKVSSQAKTINSQKSQITNLEDKADNYDEICNNLSSGNIGYAAYNFKSDASVIVVRKNERNRKFTLTAYWGNGGHVSVSYSSFSAFLSFDKESWNTSTTVTVCPFAKGATVVTFSNDVDTNTFKILIIVID